MHCIAMLVWNYVQLLPFSTVHSKRDLILCQRYKTYVKRTTNLDVADCVLKLWPYNIIQCIHTSIGCFDGLVKRQKGSL